MKLFLYFIIVIIFSSKCYAMDFFNTLNPMCKDKHADSFIELDRNIFVNNETVDDIYEELKNNSTVTALGYKPPNKERNLWNFPELGFKKNGDYSIVVNEDGRNSVTHKFSIGISKNYKLFSK